MQHGIELAAILFFMALGQGAIDVAPHMGRRVTRSFLYWGAAFAIGILILSMTALVTTMVRFAIVLLVAYLVRWVMVGIMEYLRGPFLLEPPRFEDVAATAQRVSHMPEAVCRRVTRRILHDQDTYIALLALIHLDPSRLRKEEEFEPEWRGSCDAARARVTELARRYGADGEEVRLRPAVVHFVAQALCLYERASVERTLSRSPARVLASRGGRNAVAEELMARGRRSEESLITGIPISDPHDHHTGSLTWGASALLWPALGLHRAGFRGRALALGISHAMLLGYGLVALTQGRAAGYIFLAVALLVHIQAAFALGDFAPPEASRRRKEMRKESGS